MGKLVWILAFISMYIVSIGIRLGSLLTIAMDLNSNSTETFLFIDKFALQLFEKIMYPNLSLFKFQPNDTNP